MLKPPAGLTKGARAEWRRIVPQLQELGHLQAVDRTALAAYVTLYDRWRTAEAELLTSGLTVLTPNKYPVQSPWLAIANKALAELRRYVREFGLSPAARASLFPNAACLTNMTRSSRRGELLA